MNDSGRVSLGDPRAPAGNSRRCVFTISALDTRLSFAPRDREADVRLCRALAKAHLWDACRARRGARAAAGVNRREDAMKRRKTRRTKKPRRSRKAGTGPESGQLADMATELEAHTDTSPALTGGDVDADWQRAADSGDEAVGGSVATPDQDVVDELGRALGVEQEADEEVRTSRELLEERDRRRWEIERESPEE